MSDLFEKWYIERFGNPPNHHDNCCKRAFKAGMLAAAEIAMEAKPSKYSHKVTASDCVVAIRKATEDL